MLNFIQHFFTHYAISAQLSAEKEKVKILESEKKALCSEMAALKCLYEQACQQHDQYKTDQHASQNVIQRENEVLREQLKNNFRQERLIKISVHGAR